MLYMIIPVISLPVAPFEGNTVVDQDMFILAITHGYGDGCVVKEKAVSLPSSWSVSDPVIPIVE